MELFAQVHNELADKKSNIKKLTFSGILNQYKQKHDTRVVDITKNWGLYMGIVITFKGINGSIDYLTTESCRDVNSYASIYVYSVHS